MYQSCLEFKNLRCASSRFGVMPVSPVVFVVKTQTGLTVVRSFGGFVNSVSHIAVSHCPLVFSDFDSLTFDQGQAMVKRLGKVVKVTNAVKDHTSRHIVNCWTSIEERAMKLNKFFLQPNHGKPKLVVFQTPAGFCPKMVRSGDCFTVDELMALTPVPVEKDDAKSLTKDEMMHFLTENRNGTHPDILKKKSKDALIDLYVECLNNIIQNTVVADNSEDDTKSLSEKDEGESNEAGEEESLADSDIVAGLDNESEATGLFVEVKEVKNGTCVCELRLDHRFFKVMDVKEKILAELCWKEGSADQMTSSDFKLICLNREMLDDEMLASYVPDDYDQVVFYLVLIVRGGGKGVKKTSAKTKTDKKKADLYKKALEEFSTEFKKVPVNDLAPFRADAETAMNQFYHVALTDPMKAFETAFAEMDYQSLNEAYEKTSTTSGSDNEGKMKRLSSCMFGAGLKKAKEVGEICDGLLEGAELTVGIAFFHKDSPPTLQAVRDLLKTYRDRKYGAMEAQSSQQTAGAQMTD